MGFNQHDAIRSDAEFTIAQVFDLYRREFVFILPIINQDKVVSGSLVFGESDSHKSVTALVLTLVLFAAQEMWRWSGQ